MADPIPVVDLFAGPGGLNEGFSAVGEREGSPAFQTIASFEMESSAIATLKLRSVFRSLSREGRLPSSYYQLIRGDIDWATFTADRAVALALNDASHEVHQVELGSAQDDSENLIRRALDRHSVAASQDEWVLIGGPPCQAYSLAGRSRRANDVTFSSDKKHFLYREYLRIIATFRPPVFVMENVKGLLSSSNGDVRMFDKIIEDLRHPTGGLHYEIRSLVVDSPADGLEPSDFVIRAELFGVPQRRHRVILVGVRSDIASDSRLAPLVPSESPSTVGEALAGMPKLRSGISPARLDSHLEWAALRSSALPKAGTGSELLSRGMAAQLRDGDPGGTLGDWLIDPQLAHVVQHESRSHMRDDLLRYAYASEFAATYGRSPKLGEFPAELQPNHKNAAHESRPFEDRFRVQVQDRPATTIVSHIAKDGHYYIHPDPQQMRSLTVREAARLQTFPDNYFFMGNRTQQYHQVGNAVPPLLAHQIAERVFGLLRR